MGEISSKITKKNQDIVVDEVFTNSAEYGIISQRDFFDKDIANSGSIAGYYIVEPNDFVYNPRISTTAPFGPIKRNKLERTGAMSPLYYVFRPHDIDLSYLECFFQTSCWHAFMRFNGNTGARSDRFAITDKVFSEMPISMPQDIEEQKKVGLYFEQLDTLITLHQRECNRIKKLENVCLKICLYKIEIRNNMSTIEQLMEYAIVDIVDMIATGQFLEYDEAMDKFYNSTVFDKLQDTETGLYLESSAYIYDLFKDEMNFGKIVQAEI